MIVRKVLFMASCFGSILVGGGIAQGRCSMGVSVRRFMVVAACVLVVCLLGSGIALASGSGGGSSSGSSSGSGGSGAYESSGGSGSMKSWSRQDLELIFKDVQPERRSEMVQAFRGTTITRRQLLQIRQSIFEQSARDAERSAAILGNLLTCLEVMDKAGQISQTGLSFVPGVGWVTSASLGAARGAADSYRDGKSGAEIATNALTGGAAAGLVGKFSPLNADKAFNTARVGVNIARTTASKEVQKKAAKVAAKAVSRYAGAKVAEMETGEALGAAMNEAAQVMGVQNRAPEPDYQTMSLSAVDWQGP